MPDLTHLLSPIKPSRAVQRACIHTLELNEAGPGLAINLSEVQE
jgi:hypothetical protein